MIGGFLTIEEPTNTESQSHNEPSLKLVRLKSRTNLRKAAAHIYARRGPSYIVGNQLEQKAAWIRDDPVL